MTSQKRKYVLRILAAIYTEEDTEFEHPTATLIKIPVSARSPEEAEEKVGKAIATIAQSQKSIADQEEIQKHLESVQKTVVQRQQSTQITNPQEYWVKKKSQYTQSQNRFPQNDRLTRAAKDAETLADLVNKFLTETHKNK